ncbi:MAG TPA: putative toxin-antitoxin system toxin component, PIN family [Terriglobales bacterium]|nr:putative toxin-antitoxin system toxin component, PIN family [Terriglobales bacterium]
MVRAVLDTNVVVSAHLKPEGTQALILDLALSRYFRCFVSEALLQEYEGVLLRPRFGLPAGEIFRSLRKLRVVMTLVAPKKLLEVAADPDDNKVVECALEARADFVVTGNLAHFPKRFQDIRFILPRDFLTILASELP